MGFRKRETDLERELRAQRPQPREQFVQMLSRQNVAPKPHRRGIPALIVVAAVTLVFAASLGTAGAVGAATHSVTSLYRSVAHIVESPKSGSTTNLATLNNHRGDPGGFVHVFPFRSQYGFLVPLCFVGPPRHTVFVPVFAAFFLLIFDPEQYSPGFCRRL